MTTVTPDPRSPHRRVLFLVNDLRMGGAERSLVNLINHSARLRPALAVIHPAADLLRELHPSTPVYDLSSPRTTPSRPDELAGIAERARHQRRGQPPGRMLLELPGLLRKVYRLARVVRHAQVHTVSTFLNRSHTLALLAKLLFVPRVHVVINVHELLSDHLTRYFSRLERPLMRAFIQAMFPRALRVIAVSEGVRQDLIRHFTVPAHQIIVVPNPIDAARIQERARADVTDMPNGDTPRIVGVGRLVHLKGFDVLLEAVARLPASRNATVYIIGDGPERSALQRSAHELGLGDRVVFLGQRDNPWAYIARATVMVVPSRVEAAPNVIGEALALSVPIIATRCSEGVVEYLGDGHYGVLVRPDDPEQLAAAIDRLLRDPGETARLRRAMQSRQHGGVFETAIRQYEQALLGGAGA